MKVKSESEFTQSCPTLSDPMDCSLPWSSIHGIFQARVLEWGAIAFSKRYSMQAEIKLSNILGSSGVLFLVYYHGEGNGTPLQYPCLENPMDRGAW